MKRPKVAIEPLPVAKTRTERLRLKIEEEILTGQTRPGQKLDEEEIAARFSLSRTPVREALKALSSSGLVEIKPHQGAYVAVLTPHTISEMIEVMVIFETSCAAAAARRHTTQDREMITAALEACETASEKKKPNAFYKANVSFHEAIYRASRNSFLATQAIGLRQRLEPYRRQISYHTGLMERANREHREIVQAIFEMNERQAVLAMTGHLDTLKESISTMIEAISEKPPTRRRRVA